MSNGCKMNPEDGHHKEVRVLGYAAEDFGGGLGMQFYAPKSKFIILEKPAPTIQEKLIICPEFHSAVRVHPLFLFSFHLPSLLSSLLSSSLPFSPSPSILSPLFFFSSLPLFLFPLPLPSFPLSSSSFPLLPLSLSFSSFLFSFSLSPSTLHHGVEGVNGRQVGRDADILLPTG